MLRVMGNGQATSTFQRHIEEWCDKKLQQGSWVWSQYTVWQWKWTWKTPTYSTYLNLQRLGDFLLQGPTRISQGKTWRIDWHLAALAKCAHGAKAAEVDLSHPAVCDARWVECGAPVQEYSKRVGLLIYPWCMAISLRKMMNHGMEWDILVSDKQIWDPNDTQKRTGGMATHLNGLRKAHLQFLQVVENWGNGTIKLIFECLNMSWLSLNIHLWGHTIMTHV